MFINPENSTWLFLPAEDNHKSISFLPDNPSILALVEKQPLCSCLVCFPQSVCADIKNIGPIGFGQEELPK